MTDVRDPLRTARFPSPVALQAPAIEPAGVETPGLAAPAPVGSPISQEQFLKEARAL